MVAVLVLDGLQCQLILLRVHWISQLSKLFVTVCEMTLVAQRTIFMRLVMSATFSFVLIVDIVDVASSIHLFLHIAHVVVLHAIIVLVAVHHHIARHLLLLIHIVLIVLPHKVVHIKTSHVLHLLLIHHIIIRVFYI